MGDIVAAEPVLRFLRDRSPDNFFVWAVRRPFVELLSHNPALDSVWTVSCLSEWIILRRLLGEGALTLHVDGHICHFGVRLRNSNPLGLNGANYYEQGRSLLEVFCNNAKLTPFRETPRLYLPEEPAAASLMENLGYPVVVMHCASNEIERNWPVESFQIIAQYMLKQGWSVIEIGHKSQMKLNHPRFIDACGQYRLSGYAELIRRATLFIGVDSGFAHFANALETHAIVLLGKFKTFASYNPFSESADKKRMLLIHADGPLSGLSVDDVISAIENRMPTAQ